MEMSKRSSTHAATPEWIKVLTDDELNFAKRFIVNSGSLKALANEYEVSYPTLRSRLDSLIERINSVQSDDTAGPVKSTVRQLLRDGAVSVHAARKILSAVDQEKEEWEK